LCLDRLLAEFEKIRVLPREPDAFGFVPACRPAPICPPACAPPTMCPPRPPPRPAPAICPPIPCPPPLWSLAKTDTSGKQLIPKATVRATQFRTIASERNHPKGNKFFIKSFSRVVQESRRDWRSPALPREPSVKTLHPSNRKNRRID
jgi:hypothetical protein